MKTSLRKSQFTPASGAQLGGAAPRMFQLMSADLRCSRLQWRTDLAAGSGSLAVPPSASRSLIYVVDDKLPLTELYTIVLENSGYAVQSFHSRPEALALLRAHPQKPDLLVTDYLGHPMPADEFMQACRAAHSGLRILMASGIDHAHARFSGRPPDAFIWQPFSPEEFVRAVRVVLATGLIPEKR